MKHMRVKLKDIRPNPFRDFSLYPIDQDQVQRLKQSMDSLGFFSGVTLRRADGAYEMAAGHHRKEAAAQAGIEEVDAVVDTYSDEEMVKIMMVENMTQRGHNAASVLDSVAAHCKLLAKDILSGEGSTSKILEAGGQLAQNQAKVIKNGPGAELLYRAINGFTKEERRVNKEQENMTETEIQQALSTLKTSGVMAKLVSDIYDEVEAGRKRLEEAKRIASERMAELERQAEQRRQDEAKRKDEEALKAAAESERKKHEAEEAKARKDANAAVKAREAEVAKAKSERLEKERAAQREKDREAREYEAERRKEQEAKDKAEADKRRKEREVIAAQNALEAVYDPACAHIFRLSSHETTFRNFVLSVNGKRFIPKANQLALAKQIRAEIDAIEHERSVDLGSVTIIAMLNDHLSELIGMQKQIDKDERDRLDREITSRGVEDAWKTLRGRLVQAEAALTRIVKAQKSWRYDKALFPMHLDDIDRIIQIGDQMQKLKKALGY